MKITELNVTGMQIQDAPRLDWINVYWENLGDSRGSVTITCYGCAWTAVFGAMGGDTIQQFFRRAGTDYLTTKLGISEVLKSRKKDDEYLGRIINAVKAAMAEQPVASTPDMAHTG